jgi:hypothetical protein
VISVHSEHQKSEEKERKKSFKKERVTERRKRPPFTKVEKRVLSNHSQERKGTNPEGSFSFTPDLFSLGKAKETLCHR